MTTARTDSQGTQYGRRRSNTVQSSNPVAAALKLGDSKVLNSWVHDPKDSPRVIFNQSWWPGVTEGDVLRVTASQSSDDASGFLFTVPRDEGCPKPTLQISLPKNAADVFGLKNNTEVTVTKVDRETYSADHIEFTFQDQYLGRNDMWRLGEHLVGQCVFVEQEVSFIGVIAAKVQNIYVDGKKVPSGYVTSKTKVIYRSLSAKVTIFIQVCRELWEFAGDGERFNEKIIHSFLPTLFSKWREAGTNHTVTIVLISRVFYDASELEYAAGPLRRDENGMWYKDFYKVITDLEVINDWKPTLVGLKDSFWAFQRDILLTHHYHRAFAESTTPDQARLVGQISCAHDGPILEALNLVLNPNETHYIDRSLSLTGAATILVTPGTGYFRVSKQLLRLTTTRMLDHGFGLDLVSLAKQPLHQSPIFSFQGCEPRLDKDVKNGSRAADPLWGGDEMPNDATRREKVTFWWEPFWIGVTFWDKQMDLPFRRDRFVARAKIHEIEMLGLLEHDVLSNIEVPFLPEIRDWMSTPPREPAVEDRAPSAAEVEQADMEVFASKEVRPAQGTVTRTSSMNTTTLTYRSSTASERRAMVSQRGSNTSSRFAPIEESPRQIFSELPPEGNDGPIPSVTGLSTSPSQSSMLSAWSASPSSSRASSRARATSDEAPSSTSSRLAKLAASWLYNPFRSSLGDQQTPTLASGNALGVSAVSTRVPIASNMAVTPSASISRSPQPMAILHSASGRSTLSRTYDEDLPAPHRGSLTRHSPLGTSPRDDGTLGKRRGMAFPFTVPLSSSLPSPSSSRTNPSRPQSAVSFAQSSLASRWQHVLPSPVYKHALKWASMVTPSCLPLTVEHFPSNAELESSYDVFSYDFVVDPAEMRSFLVRPPPPHLCGHGSVEDVRRAWALVVMRGMVAVRLVQGFQFVVRPHASAPAGPEKPALRGSKSFLGEEDATPKPCGAAEVLRTTDDPVYLSMPNEIHRLSYTGEAIQVRRYVRRMPPSPPLEYECLIWPKLGVGYTELRTRFVSHGLENYGWNRLDMLVAGYEHQFNESLWYWRTRFVVIPSLEPPQLSTSPAGERLNEEEVRLLGMDKLAEMFTRARWTGAGTDERAPVRFLPTTLGPVHSVLDESLAAQLDEVYAAGALRKKTKGERELGEMSLGAIAKAMLREEDGVPVKQHRWHRTSYPDSFTGFDLVSWLVREFRDVASREQGAEWGARLLEQGLFTHCTGRHGFLDGHYIYQLGGEYGTASTPRGGGGGGWFNKPPRHSLGEHQGKPNGVSPKRNKRRLTLTQSTVIDADVTKKSDQAESVILHHDIVQNPGTVFHFELQWIGSTARCIDDMLRQWGRTIDKYGLKLVEAYVTEIGDIRERNPFQSCFPIRLALPPPPPPPPVLAAPEGTSAQGAQCYTHHYECALLRRFGFIIDTEAAGMYPRDVEVVYTYRRTPFKHSQFVHRSGAAFVQVCERPRGFLFLVNRLVGAGAALKTRERETRPAVAVAEELRVRLLELCADEAALARFYEEETAAMGLDEPPPLSI